MRLVGGDPLRLVLNPQKNVVVLLGNNGLGKTTILDAMATSMAPYSAQFPGISDFLLSDLDVHIDEAGHRAGYMAVEALLSDEQRGEMHSNRYRRGITSAPKSNFEELKVAALAHKNDIIEGKNVELPVFVYYGTGRGHFRVPERRRGFKHVFERWDCYVNSISPETDFKRFFGWYDLMEDEERRERERLRDFNYKSPVLQAVRKALSVMVDEYENPRIETRPLRFIMDKVSEEGGHKELRIEQLSEGYKIVIAMVADLAARMAEANPSLENPLATSGIVLIDEVDLHLHPQWQREILMKLTTVFPNVQFIVSTHSPIIVVGAASIAQVVNLNQPMSVYEDCQSIESENVAQVLLSDLFGMQSLQAPKWDEKIKERDEILRKDSLTEADKERLGALDDEMKNLTSLTDANAIYTTKLLEQLARQLNLVQKHEED